VTLADLPRRRIFFLLRWFGLVHAVEVALKSIDVSRPEAAELSQPDIEFLKWFRPETIQPTLRIHSGLYKAGFAQHPQVLGHSRLRHAQLSLDFTYGLFGRDQEA